MRMFLKIASSKMIRFNVVIQLLKILKAISRANTLIFIKLQYDTVKIVRIIVRKSKVRYLNFTITRFP